MGNLTSACCNHATSSHLQELSSLLETNHNQFYRLSFDPFANNCCSLSSKPTLKTPPKQSDLMISEEVVENPQLESGSATESRFDAGDLNNAILSEKSHKHLQKNQTPVKMNIRSKQIRKRQPARRIPAEPIPDQEDAQLIEEPQTSTAPDDSIRDQNNCKSYHKLLKNYLIDHNLSQLIEEHQEKYHTRYYFVIALILIKYHLTLDFNSDYQKIVAEEILNQEKKIQKKLIQKEKLSKKMKQPNGGKFKPEELLKKRQKLQKQIEHIKVVIYQISTFSKRSCAAFFQGDIEESLKILYLKDDPVMRKKYYFDSALRIVQEIQAQVRQATSRHS